MKSIWDLISDLFSSKRTDPNCVISDEEIAQALESAKEGAGEEYLEFIREQEKTWKKRI